ncbi:hypothetical protein BVC71_11850 [Marivivens niveibacter]|uniref:Uncharacterized protein n=1 Tax=Marivivens niveibacter TaxID=1930667 RepID=A0A251WWU7_9RHOB|nr:hypothetical protein [Marivivens niveibacter]OUD08625.1 hypothetical protein BVC71_11850 [Marivivens niveibacter]
MPLAPEKRSERYIQSFDAHTLIYDCFADGDTLTLICPRLLNLWPLVRDGLRVDGKRVRIRRKKYLRYEELRIAGTLKSDVTVTIDENVLPVPVNANETQRFSGRNVLVTQCKDTPIDWITDWAKYHAAAHSVDAVLLFDNGSTTVAPIDIQNALRSISGIDTAYVISTPFPYGDKAGGRFVTPTKFLQTAVLNLGRLRFFGNAAGVLSLDVDEMLPPLNDATIFDLAEKSRLGMISFTGEWLFTDKDGPQLQKHHNLRVPGKTCTNPKWCAVPNRGAAKLSWAVHRPGGIFSPFTKTDALTYWHCFSTSTSWKKDRTGRPSGAEPAKSAILAFETYIK